LLTKELLPQVPIQNGTRSWTIPRRKIRMHATDIVFDPAARPPQVPT
jgi:hypothetical protein